MEVGRYSGFPLSVSPSHRIAASVAFVVTDFFLMRITAAGTAPVLHRIPLHRQADMPSRLPIPGIKINTFYILFSFFFLIIFFFLHFVFLSVVFLCFCKCFRLADVEPTEVLKRIALYADRFAHG